MTKIYALIIIEIEHDDKFKTKKIRITYQKFKYFEETNTFN